MISLRMHHRQHGEKIFSVPEKAFSAHPSDHQRKPKGCCLGKVVTSRPQAGSWLGAGWEFEIRVKEAV